MGQRVSLRRDQGTLQFVSRRFVDALIHDEKPIATTAEDDIESFYTVFLYAIFSNLVTREVGTRAEQNEVHRTYKEMFGGTTVDKIWRARWCTISTFLFLLTTPTGTVRVSISDPLFALLKRYSLELGMDHLDKARKTLLRDDPSAAQTRQEGRPPMFTHERLICDLEELHVLREDDK